MGDWTREVLRDLRREEERNDRLDAMRYAIPCLQIAKMNVADMYPEFIFHGDYDGDCIPRSINVGRCNGKSEMAKRILNGLFGTPANLKFEIEKVIFNEPATIVFWKDGTKTVVKAQGEMYDPEKGLAMAIARKALGNKGSYYDIFDKWMKTYKPKSVMEAKMEPEKKAEPEKVIVTTASPLSPVTEMIFDKLASAGFSASLDNSFIKNCVVRVEEFPLDNCDICCGNCEYNIIENDDFPCADCDDFDEFVLRKDLRNGTTSKDTSKN